MGDIAEARQLIGCCMGAIIYGMPTHTSIYPSPPHLFLGIVVAMFFKCVSALHDREVRLRRILATHTVIMFSFVTVAIAALLHTLSGSYIDNRAFPGPDTSPWPGPIGYQLSTYHEPLRVIPLVALVSNGWLVDGLLVRSVLGLTFQGSDADRRSRSIVTTSFAKAGIGPSLFRSLCTLPL